MKPIACGYVTRICRSQKTFYWHFLTVLGVEHEGRVYVHQLSAKERPFLREGAYLKLLKNGQFRFSRLKWKQRELTEAVKHAQELLAVLR